MVNNLSSFFSPQELDEVLTTTREKGMLLFMITTFKDKETEKIYHQIFSKKLPIDIQHVALRKLIMLNNAKTLEDLRIPPSNYLENDPVIELDNIVFASTNNFGCSLSFILQKLETLRLWIKKGEVMKLNFIEPPSIGEILREEFMEPMNLSAYSIAQSIHVPVSRIQDILHDRRKITIDTSLRLAKLFGVSDEYFINMQNDIDIQMQKRKLDFELQQIKTIQYA